MQQIPFVLRTAQSEDNLLRACILASNILHAPIIFAFPGFSNPSYVRMQANCMYGPTSRRLTL